MPRSRRNRNKHRQAPDTPTWAARQGMHHAAAGGVLVAALGILARPFGLAPRRPQTLAAPA